MGLFLYMLNPGKESKHFRKGINFEGLFKFVSNALHCKIKKKKRSKQFGDLYMAVHNLLLPLFCTDFFYFRLSLPKRCPHTYSVEVITTRTMSCTVSTKKSGIK